MGKVQSIRIIFENYEVLKLDIEEFERIRIDRVSHWYEKLGGSRLDENLCAYGGLSFTLKPNVKADLRPWANESVRLILIADCGPKNNTVGDWAAWGDCHLASE